jgi:hypothetical protein
VEELKIIIPVVAVIISLLGLLHNQNQVKIKLDERVADLEADVKALEANYRDLKADTERDLQRTHTELKERLIVIESNTRSVPVLEEKMKIFWGLVEQHIPTMLMHPDSNERDLLISKAKSGTITRDEAATLKAMLEVEMHHDDVSDGDKWLDFLYVVKLEYILRGLD